MSPEKRLKAFLDMARMRAEAFRDRAPVFQVPVRLNDLIAEKGGSTKTRLKEVCEGSLASGTPVQTFSAKFVDLDGQPLFFYLGDRWFEKGPVSKQVMFL